MRRVRVRAVDDGVVGRGVDEGGVPVERAVVRHERDVLRSGGQDGVLRRALARPDDATVRRHEEAPHAFAIEALFHLRRKLPALVFLLERRAHARGQLRRAGCLVGAALHAVDGDGHVQHEVHHDDGEQERAEQQEILAHEHGDAARAPAFAASSALARARLGGVNGSGRAPHGRFLAFSRYPSPFTVTRLSGCEGSASIFSRRRRTWVMSEFS